MTLNFMCNKTIAAVIVITPAILFLAGCGYQQSATSPGGNSQQSSPQQNKTSTPQDNNQSASAITIKNFTFSPATLTIAKGAKVTWTNEDSAPHQIVSDPGSAVSFSGPQIPQGQNYSFTFDTAGTFSYHCGIHPSMLGKIVVQ
jgi:plastocyanin